MIYTDQVESKINYNTLNVIIFPDNIEKVASSFVQGFFAKIVERVGYAEFDNLVSIKAKNEELANNIRNDLFV